MVQQPQINPLDLETPTLFDLSGKVALITGASGALGGAVARGLAVNGVDLVLASVENDALQLLSREIQSLGVKALPVYCDVTSESQVEGMVQDAVAEFGKIDILITCAGLAHRELLVDQSLENWRRVMDVNVQGTLLCCKAVAKEMIKS